MHDPAPQRPATVTFAELAAWCGRTRPTAVARWLQQNGILYFLNAENQPVTTSTALNEALMRGRKTEPNYTALGKRS